MTVLGLTIDRVSDLGPVATFAGAMIAIVVARIQIAFNRRAQAEKQAYDAYQAFLKDCLDEPQLASGIIKVAPLEDWKTADRTFHKYEWLVAKMLSACEQIIDVTKSDRNWLGQFEICVTFTKNISSPST